MAKMKRLEVDFVARGKDGYTKYIQVSLTVKDAFYPGNFALKLKKSIIFTAGKVLLHTTVKVFRFGRN